MRIVKVTFEQLYPVINEPYFNVRLGGEAELEPDETSIESKLIAYRALKHTADLFHKQNWPHMYSPDGILATQTSIIPVDKKGASIPITIADIMLSPTVENLEREFKYPVSGKPELQKAYNTRLKQLLNGTPEYK